MGHLEGKALPLAHILLPRRRQRAVRYALAAALPALALAHWLAGFTSTRCGSIDWSQPTIDDMGWRAVPRRAFPHARFDESMREYAKSPVLIQNAMDGWPALAGWTPASLRGRYGNKSVEVFYWGATGLDWHAKTEIEAMPLAQFVDELTRAAAQPAAALAAGAPSGPRARAGYVQESSFLEEEEEEAGGEEEGEGGGAEGEPPSAARAGASRAAAPPFEPRALPAAASAPPPPPRVLRAARRRAQQHVPPSKARAWQDVLWFPHAPLPDEQIASLESAFWMGAAGVGTGIHYDASPAFLHQVFGSKRVVLWPPSARRALCISPKYNYGAELSTVDARAFMGAEGSAAAAHAARRADAVRKCPDFAALPNATVDLRPGETLAIPPGWYHATLTLDTSISVAVRVQSACQRRADWLDDLLLALHNAGLYKRGNCVCHDAAAEE